MDWHEFYESDEYAEYRKKLVEEIGAVVFGLVVHSNRHSDSATMLKGALDLAYKILNIPVKSTTDPKQQEKYQDIIRQDMARVAEFIIKERMQA